jgi:NADPH-dependent 7-cyano-7-deazaguanine reductase QueF
VVQAADPITVTVVGDFSPRGGLSSVVTASWSRKRGKR